MSESFPVQPIRTLGAGLLRKREFHHIFQARILGGTPHFLGDTKLHQILEECYKIRLSLRYDVILVANSNVTSLTCSCVCCMRS